MSLNPTAIYTGNLGSTGNSLRKRGSSVFLGGEEVQGDGDFVPKKGRVTITGKLDYDTTTAAGSTFTPQTLVPKSYVDGLGSGVTVVKDQDGSSTSDTSVYSCLAANNDFAPASHNHAGTYAPTAHNHTGVYAPLSHTHAIAEVTSLQSSLDAKLSTAVKNFNGAATDLNGNFEDNTLTLETSDQSYAFAGTTKLFAEFNASGKDIHRASSTTSPTHRGYINQWVVDRGGQWGHRNAYYIPHGKAVRGSTDLVIEAPSNKPVLGLKWAYAEQSFAVTQGAQYTISF